MKIQTKNYLDHKIITTHIIKRLVFEKEILLAICEFFYEELKKNKTSKFEITFRNNSRSIQESETFKIKSYNKKEVDELKNNIKDYLNRELISNIQIFYYRPNPKNYGNSDIIRIDINSSDSFLECKCKMSLESENNQWLNSSFMELDKILTKVVKKIITKFFAGLFFLFY